MKIWLVQMESKLKDKVDNLKKICNYIDKAVDAKVNLIAFPELALTGYVCGLDFYDLAEVIPGSSTAEIIERAKKGKIYVTFGMPELEDGVIYNSAPFFGPKGLIGVYRKIYLPNFDFAGVRYEELMYFKPASDIITFDTEFGKLGIEICYDFYYPEITRIHALQGAWILLNISAAPIGVPEYFQLLARARATENVAWFGYVNQIGEQEEVFFGGGTCIVDCSGEIKKSASMGADAKEEVIEYEIDSESIFEMRLNLPILRNVRPEILQKASEIVRGL